MDVELLQSTRSLQLRAQQGLSAFLQGFQWSYFFTSTFRLPATYPRVAIKRVQSALVFGNERLFVAAEPHYLGNYHAHGLIGNTFSGFPDEALWAYHKALERMGYYRLGDVSSLSKVSAYCAKYVTKDRTCDWDLTGGV